MALIVIIIPTNQINLKNKVQVIHKNQRMAILAYKNYNQHNKKKVKI